MVDENDLTLLTALLSETMPSLLIQTTSGAYPYEVDDKEELAPPRFSMSTNSMIAHALACLTGVISDSRLTLCSSSPVKALLPGHMDCLKRTTNRIVTAIVSASDSDPYSSGSFGDQDPLTLSWLVELLQAAPGVLVESADRAHRQAVEHLDKTARDRVAYALRNPDSPVMNFGEPTKDNHYARPVLHPVPLLRILHTAQMFDIESDTDDGAAYDWFLRHLYIQLSRRSIEHSDFDIADLVFCLEGLLTASPTKVAKPIIDGVLTAILDVRQVNPTLRPITPFKTSAQGAVHLFSSVEVFSSLLRCAHVIQQRGSSDFFVALKPVLHGYLSWLQATKVSGRLTLADPTSADRYDDDIPRDYSGWQSEYSHNERRTVHLWLTSQIVLFLHSYHLLLTRDVAARSLSGVDLRAQLVGPASERRRTGGVTAAAEEDPLQLDAASPYRVISRLHEEFVEPRVNEKSGRRPSYSCLLYGPPGTGKTTLARRVAESLGWPLLTITTSDFIIAGEAQVEARAKNLFAALELQDEMVVFFDEIDRLVLDRDAAAYSSQSDMLQFMTPSMLTKINNLRMLQKVIFIVGTNYADRIDAAVKRAGRIDQRLLVLPPDLARRTEILRAAVTDLPGSPPDPDVVEAALVGRWRTIPELRSAVRLYESRGGSLADQVKAVIPAVSLNSYRKRISETGDSTCPPELLEEAFLLLYLDREGQDPELPPSFDWLRGQWDTARDGGVIRDEAVRDRLTEIFAG